MNNSTARADLRAAAAPLWRARGSMDARHRATDAQQSRCLTERLGACLRRSLIYRRETARDLAQLLVALVAASAVMAFLGRLLLDHPG